MKTALFEGIGRVARAPAILAGVWLVTILVSLPLTLGVRAMIAQHLGSSLAADTALSGVNYDWWQEFSDQATGPGVTFTPTIIGFGAVLDNLSAFLDDEHRPVIIVSFASAYILIWIFLAGGIIDRYTRGARGSGEFFGACGRFFGRFLRLAVMMWIVYAFLFAYMHRWLFDRLFTSMTRDLSVERTAFLARVALYLVFGLVFAGCNLIFDYTKVRTVVEDRRSMLAAVPAAVRFIRKNYTSAVGLYAADFALFVLVLACYALVAPGAGSGGWSLWIGFAVSQIYIVLRLFVKLVFWASETALVEARSGVAAATPPPA